MTITFVPGEPSSYRLCVVQGHWRNHHIVAYGLGNNLIISTGNATSELALRKPSYQLASKGLQTIYLSQNPRALALNPTNGYLAVAYTDSVQLYAPVNEFMKDPKWHLIGGDLLIAQGSSSNGDVKNGDVKPNHYELSSIAEHLGITCIQWARNESELFIATIHRTLLVYCWNEDSQQWESHWNQHVPSMVIDLSVSSDGSTLVTRGLYDRFAKVWQRQNVGDSYVFEVAYLSHSRGTWVTQLHLRGSTLSPSPVQSRSATPGPDEIANEAASRDLRYLARASLAQESLEVVYTVTNTGQVTAWGLQEVCGHQHIKQWALINVGAGTEIVVVENTVLKTNYDVLIAFDVWSGKYQMFKVNNITSHPPSNISIVPMMTQDPIPKYTFPILSPQAPVKDLTMKNIQSHDFQVHQRPVSLVLVDYLWHRGPVKTATRDDGTHLSGATPLSLLVHDRVKNTIRLDLLEIKDDKANMQLINKFQGHGKLIQKLYKLFSRDPHANILLSTSNFSHHNYLWEPLYLGLEPNQRMSLAKRFEIDLCRTLDGCEAALQNLESNHIVKAVMISDIPSDTDGFRRHLVATIEAHNELSVWDCNSKKYDDLPAELVWRQPTPEATVRSFVVVPARHADAYFLIAIYSHSEVKLWRLDTAGGKITIADHAIDALPQDQPIHLVASFNSVNRHGNLVLVMDPTGVLRIYGVQEERPERLQWQLNHEIDTGVAKASRIHGSDVVDKVAVVDSLGSHLLIWHTQLGVLEYEEEFSSEYGAVADLDWTFVAASLATEGGATATNAILSVGFDRFVFLYTQLRYDYTNKVPTFAVIEKVDISDYTSHCIGDSIWLDGCYLVIGCGNQFFIDDKWIRLAGNSALDLTIRELVLPGRDEGVVYDVNYLVAVLNGPLPVYHPQVLVQCLFMSQYDFVQEVFLRLFNGLRTDSVEWDLGLNLVESAQKNGLSRPKRARSTTPDPTDDGTIDVFTTFNLSVADLLITALNTTTLPLLTRKQQATLVLLVTIVTELRPLLVSLDDNGLRFLMGFKLFLMNPKQHKLLMRDVLWALHCDNKEMILGVVERDYFKGQATWNNIKATGLVYWADSHKLAGMLEQAARLQFGDTRTPEGFVAAIYLALRKKQILLGLWRTVSHEEKTKMLKFLANDFNEPRWRLAANKNAYVLMGKHRYMDAAGFFLLGESPGEACAVIANKVGDVELALALAKLWQFSLSNHDSLAVVSTIENYVVPDTLATGSRWMALWVFWQLQQKELSVQALIKPPIDMFVAHAGQFSDRCRDLYLTNPAPPATAHSFLRDDPVLALLFDNLRQSKINYHHGAKGVSPLEEFAFIVKVSSIYTRMGCDYLAMVLLQHWQFQHELVVAEPTSPAMRRVLISDLASLPMQRRISISDLKDRPAPLAPATTPQLTKNKAPPPQTEFQEADLLAFDF